MKTLVCCFCIAVSSALHVLASDQMAYSPDGKVVAMGWGDGRIELRDGLTGDVRAAFRPEGTPTSGLVRSAVKWTPRFAFSPDGKVLASSCGYAPVTLWEASTGKKIRSLTDPSVGYDLTFSGDGSRLFGVGVDAITGPHRLTLWDVKSGKTVRSMTIEEMEKDGNRNRFGQVCFSKSGAILVVETYEDGNLFLRVWDAQTGEETMKISSNAGYPLSWALSPDGKVLITRDHSRSSGWPTEHAMYDTATGNKVKRWTDEG